MTSLALKMDPWTTGVLHKDVHGRLVAEIDSVARDASIVPEFIWKPLVESCGDKEVSYIKRFKFHRQDRMGGLAYVGRNPKVDVTDRMSAMAGALLRNFIRARVMTVEELIDVLDKDGVPSHACVAIPNFYVEKSLGGGKMADWRVGLLFDFLLQRRKLGLQTLLYVSDLKAMGSEWGPAFERYVKDHFIEVPV